jgi:aryl-alcohol dehydrogenase-like predicted oxidoreductase
MRYKLLGRSGLRVSEICLGTMTFGDDWGWGAPEATCRTIYQAFREAGGNFIDTANHYTDGSSERLLGDLIAGEREEVVLASKYSLNGRPKDPNGGGNHRKSMVQSLEASLRRLNTDYIDLYWVHAWDRLTPVEEMMRALDDMVRAGKVLYVGISDAPAWVVAQANTLADLRGWSRFVGLQIQYSLIERTPERDLLPMAAALDIAVTAWGPLGAGLLTGKFSRGADPQERKDARLSGSWGAAFLTDRNLKIAQEVTDLAREIDRSPAQVAVAWVRQRSPGVIIPIVGARKKSQIEDSLGALTFELTEEQVTRLDKISHIDLGFPHDFLRQPNIERVIYGEALVDDHRGPRLS